MKFEYGSGNDTIFAPATPAGKSALAIVRMSGPAVTEVFLALCNKLPSPRHATLVRVSAGDGTPIDQAVAIYFPAHSSPTGEDSGEFHLHGNFYLVEALADELRGHGLRLAKPGEFTRRAVMAGKMDLMEAEGLADLLEAETVKQRRQAMYQLYGAASDPIVNWRDTLLDALALLEADIDFSDEGDVQENELSGSALIKASSVATSVAEALADRGIGERIRAGFRVVIAGPPNAGKSTLLNCLAGRDVAIVTEIPGTTRDALEVRLDLSGVPVRLIDTAGLRDTADRVEQLGIDRANQELIHADCIIWLSSVDSEFVKPELDLATANGAKIILVGSQVDRVDPRSEQYLGATSVFDIMISARTGFGINELIGKLGSALPLTVSNESVVISRARHRSALSQALEALLRLPISGGDADPYSHVALWAEDIRLAIFHLGSVTGHARPDDVLDRIFASFCIGK